MVACWLATATSTASRGGGLRVGAWRRPEDIAEAAESTPHAHRNPRLLDFVAVVALTVMGWWATSRSSQAIDA
jgi:hypothetical protein